jgi:hypothetical protein
MGGERVESLLVKYAGEVTDVVLRDRIVWCLGRMGTASSIKILRQLERDPEPSVRQRASFALILVTHRIGEGEASIPLDEKLMDPPTGASIGSFDLGRPERILVEDALESLSGRLYGLQASVDFTYSIDCDAYYLLFLDAEHFGRRLSDIITRRPLLIGVLAKRAPEDGSFSTYRLILAGPGGSDRFYLAVFRSDGRLVHCGGGSTRGSDVTFEIGSVDIEGNLPLHLQGAVRRGTVELDGAVFGAVRRRSTRFPAPLQPTGFRFAGLGAIEEKGRQDEES